MKRRAWPCLVATLISGCAADAGDQGLRERLAGALEGRRVVEPRLYGLDGYGSCQASKGDGEVIPRVSCEPLPAPGSRHFETLSDLATEIRAALADSTFEALHAAGVLGTVWHQDNASSVRRALDHLEQAYRLRPDDATVAGDLAAAHLVAAEVRQDPDHLIQALDLLEEIHQRGVRDPPVLFNRALAMERLVLVAQGRDAWTAYLESAEEEPEAWRMEASERREALARLDVDPGQSWRTRALEAVADRNRDEIRALVRESPQRARAMVLSRLLGEWAEEELKGDRDGAAEALWGARAFGEALSSHTGERSPFEAVAGVDGAQGDRLAMARAVRAWHKGQYLFSVAPDYDRAKGLLADAVSRLTALDHHLALWARYQSAGIDLFEGHFDKADRTFRSIAREADRSRHLALAGQALWALGVSAVRQGRHEEALLHYREAQELFRLAGEEEHAGALRYLMAEGLRNLGREQQAVLWLLGAQEALRRYRSSVWTHNTLLVFGRHATAVGASHSALSLREEAVRVATNIGVPHYLAESKFWKSRTLAELGEYGAAHGILTEAKAHMADIPSGPFQERIAADIRLTEALLAGTRRPDEAIPALAAAIDYFQTAGPTQFLPTLRTTQARAHLVAGDTARAEDLLLAAIEYLEQSGSTMEVQANRAGLVESTSAIFDEMVALQLARGRGARALEFHERARRVLSRDVAGDRAPQEWTTEKLSDAGTVIVEYGVLSDEVVVWVLHAGSLTTRLLTDSPSELEAKVDGFQQLMRGSGSDRRLEEAAREIHDALLAPIGDLVGGASKLVLVPDRFLHTVAFPALMDRRSGRWLAEDFELVFAASASQYLAGLSATPGRTAPESALLMGSPDFDRRRFPALSALEGAADEVLEISGLYPQATTLAGGAATPEMLRSQLHRHQVLHFAGHAVFSPDRPEQSLLLLAPGGTAESGTGTISAREISALRLPELELVVLSACSTLGAEEGRIGGLLGLSGSFLTAGAHGVVATLWNVDDDATAELMTRFHQEYRTHGNPGRALQAAQLALIDSTEPELRSPRAWAAFVYTGA